MPVGGLRRRRAGPGCVLKGRQQIAIRQTDEGVRMAEARQVAERRDHLRTLWLRVLDASGRRPR